MAKKKGFDKVKKKPVKGNIKYCNMDIGHFFDLNRVVEDPVKAGTRLAPSNAIKAQEKVDKMMEGIKRGLE